ncbi:MAG: ArsR/SmtB family transcription factor [Actinomycetes bacterium]
MPSRHLAPAHAFSTHTPSSTDLGGEAPIHEIKADLFKALAHPVRVRVLELLVEGEQGVSDLLAETGMEPSHLSQHLAVLRRAGVVVANREGNAVRYRLAHEAVADLLAGARTFLVSTLGQTRELLAGLEDGSR